MSNPETPLASFVEAASTASDPVLMAQHPATGDDDLKHLVGHSWSAVREELAKRPYLDGLAALAQDDEVKVRIAVAKQRETPPDILIKLSTDSNAKVRAAVRGNKSAPDEARAQAALLDNA